MVYVDWRACHSHPDFEVDSTESVWYTYLGLTHAPKSILKLTPQSQYGIDHGVAAGCQFAF